MSFEKKKKTWIKVSPIYCQLHDPLFEEIFKIHEFKSLNSFWKKKKEVNKSNGNNNNKTALLERSL